MTARTGIYRRLTTFEPLKVLISTEDEVRVFAKKSMTSSVEDHPYIVYKLGNNTNAELAETVDVSNQFLQIFVHDYTDTEVADYIKIDEVLRQIKASFFLWNSPEDGIIAVRYLETSQDLNDDTLNTVMKYIRFQVITKEQ